jgi:MSHA pilin protein MshA
MSNILRNFIIFQQEKNMKLKRKKNEEGFTLIELIMVIVILGIMSAVAIPKFLSLSDSAQLSSARGVGSAISGSIQAAHSDFLINGTPYTMASVLDGTAFTGGVTNKDALGVQLAAGAPAVGEIRDNGAGGISLNSRTDIFTWTWTVPVNDTPALIEEDITSPGFTP